MRDRWATRRQRRAAEERALDELRRDYVAGLEDGHPDALESARDHGDLDQTPWRVEVVGAAAIIGLVVAVGALVALFVGIQALVER